MFDSMVEMVERAEASGQSLHEIVFQAEAAQSGEAPETIWARMQRRLEVMRRSTEQGLAQPIISLSGISGGSAYRFWHWLDQHQPLTGPILSRALARASGASWSKPISR